MTVEVWFAYVIACSVLLFVPGPTITIVVSYALGSGRASGIATVPGAVLGDFTAMTLSLLGAGAILAASASLFTALKLFGAAYLIWMGVQLWRSSPTAERISIDRRHATRRRMFWNCLVVTALNPKSIVFFIAFVPQFVNSTAPVLPQFLILEATFLVLAAVSLTVWTSLAGRLRAYLQRPGAARGLNRAAGSFLIAAGIVTATARRAS